MNPNCRGKALQKYSLNTILQNADAVIVAKLFKDKIYQNHGLAQKIISDRDDGSMSKFLKTFFQLL